MPYVIFAGASVALSAHDLCTQRIPNRWVVIAALGYVASLVCVAGVTHEPSRLIGALVGGVLCFCVALTLAVFQPSHLGGGDVKLLALIGVALGWQGAQATLTALVCLTMLVVLTLAVVIACDLRGWRRVNIPLAPLLFAATWSGIAGSMLARAIE